MRTFPWLACLIALAGCQGNCSAPAEPAPAAPKPVQPPVASAAPDLPTRRAAPARLVAIGDVHGDLQATRAALRAAGAIDDKDHWSGGALVVVQVGDQIDRGDDDRAVLDLFDRLTEEAAAAGGASISLLGNHEVMNVQLDLRYPTAASLKGFADLPGLRLDHPKLAELPDAAKARGAAFMPGGPYALRLAKRDVVAMVGDTVFVHGGVLPKHVAYGLGRMNRELHTWMAGNSPAPGDKITGEDGPLWSRRYSAAPDASDCKVLEEVLKTMQASRMVVGHTVQRGGISPACDGKVWRIDVGMSRYYKGTPEVLEIAGSTVRAITSAK
ncbi:MAG: metallophosphoesterase [Deltaproteobacteria bacterium]|nr:metallophosphoesterase [Deltaproteobacteria bacterium]